MKVGWKEGSQSLGCMVRSFGPVCFWSAGCPELSWKRQQLTNRVELATSARRLKYIDTLCVVMDEQLLRRSV